MVYEIKYVKLFMLQTNTHKQSFTTNKIGDSISLHYRCLDTPAAAVHRRERTEGPAVLAYDQLHNIDLACCQPHWQDIWHLLQCRFGWLARLTVLSTASSAVESQLRCYIYEAYTSGLVPWLSGRTLVFDWRAFAVLRSTYSWRVTTYVGKPSAVGKPTKSSSFRGR